MALLAYSIKFGYLQDSVDELDEARQILGALDCLKRLSVDVEADYAPKFHDPAVVKRNKKLVDQLIDEYRIGARIKRWWSKTDPQIEAPEVAEVISQSKSTVLMSDFDSPEEWASLAIAALALVTNDSFPRICIYVWEEDWRTVNLLLYLYRDENDSLVFEGILRSVDAHENRAQRSQMEDCLARLEKTGKFEEL